MKARFIRAPDAHSLRNHFSSFFRRFPLERVRPIRFHLFADNRYRLFVNGTFVGYGPARFVPTHPPFDTYELSPYLRPGQNEIRVELNFYGTSSFQTMPDGAPGWIGWQDGDEAPDLTTPGEWRCLTHHAWDAWTAHFSFAQNPAESLDTRLWHEEIHPTSLVAPEVIEDADRLWGPLTPRPAPMPSYSPTRPCRTVLAGPAKDDLELFGFQCLDVDRARHVVDALVRQSPPRPNRWRAFACWLHSPRAMSLALHGFWADLSLNGQPVSLLVDHTRGRHGIFWLPLHSGWNFLAGRLEVLEEVWAWLMGWERGAGVSLHALPDRHQQARFCLSPLMDGKPPLPECQDPESFCLPPKWMLDDGDPRRIVAARLAAWDVPAALERVEGTLPLRLEKGGVRMACFDFGDQFYGHPALEVEAPPGTLLDISYDDWLRPDGAVNLYLDNVFTNATDRVVLRGGAQPVDLVNPRGGRYLQLAFRLPPGAEATSVVVRDVFIRSRRTLADQTAHFSSGDPILDWAVDASYHTVTASTDETFSDCPWRERACYLGDGWVNLRLLLQMTPSMDISRYFLRLFAWSQLPDGQLPACAPSWLRRPHGDFSLIWILALHDYWSATGEVELVRELWPGVQRLWASPTWLPDDQGLWSSERCHLFVDWGCPRSERRGPANACLNILRVAAARALATLAEAAGWPEEQTRFRDEAERVCERLHETLWLASERRFAPYRDGTSAALHANILALRFGVGDADALLRYLQPLLERNLEMALRAAERPVDLTHGFAELYFFSYLLPALAEHGRLDLALRLVRQHYGYLKSTMDGLTLPECLHRAVRRGGSGCHSWSGAPALLAVPYLLGFRQRHAGDPREWELVPPPPEVKGDRIAATVATRFGYMQIAWQRVGRRWQASWTAPEGVRVHLADGV